MPTLQRFGSVSVRMYADDHHPAHVHIVGADFQLLVRLSDLRILAGTARGADVSSALDWAKANRKALLAKWTELNERG